MQVLGIRFCSVHKEAEALAEFLNKLGMPQRSFGEQSDDFMGAVFPAGDSWVEMWNDGPEMPAGIMLQVVVDDADAFAEHARNNGLEPHGPVDAHGERIYYLKAPTGLQMSFQSAAAES